MNLDTLAALGGLDGLRRVVTVFYEKVFPDPMIGFMFAGLDRARLIDLEVAFTARACGAEVPYAGRGMRAAHDRHPITHGHFDRRAALLREALADCGAPASATEAWMRHVEALRTAVLGARVAARADCDAAPPPGPALVIVEGRDRG